MISGIIEVEADYTCRDLDYSGYLKTEFNYCFMENIQKLLGEMQIDFICACKMQGQTHQAAASLETIQVLVLFSQMCALRTARGIICRCNWIADYTIIMLVQKVT